MRPNLDARAEKRAKLGERMVVLQAPAMEVKIAVATNAFPSGKPVSSPCSYLEETKRPNAIGVALSERYHRRRNKAT